MLRANYHTHTTLCDGDDTPEDVAAEAFRLGFRHLGFSGHMDPDIHMVWPGYVKKIGELRKAYAGRMDILMGVELDNIYDPSSCPGAEYIIGSTHFLDVDSPSPMSVDSTPENMAELADTFFGGDYYALSKAYYELEAQVFDRTKCTFVGHFDLVTRFNDDRHFLDETDPRYLGPALEAMEYLVSEGVPFEINCGAVNRGRKKELYPRPELLRALKGFGGEIFISADAHQKERLCGGFAQAVKAAIDAGFTHMNILVHEADGSVGTRQLALDTL